MYFSATMGDTFILSVEYKGAAQHFDAELLVMGYTHRFRVHIAGTDLFFERDEEGRYRAVLPLGVSATGKLPDSELLKAIALQIEAILE